MVYKDHSRYEWYSLKVMQEEFPGGSIGTRKLWRAIQPFISNEHLTKYSYIVCIDSFLFNHDIHDFTYYDVDEGYYFKNIEDYNLIRLAYNV